MAVTLTMDELGDAKDLDIGSSDWIEIDQPMIELFADATRDHQWIHVDHDKAAEGPFGQTIAHGFLTVSLLPELLGPDDHCRGFEDGRQLRDGPVATDISPFPPVPGSEPPAPSSRPRRRARGSSSRPR